MIRKRIRAEEVKIGDLIIQKGGPSVALCLGGFRHGGDDYPEVERWYLVDGMIVTRQVFMNSDYEFDILRRETP